MRSNFTFSLVPRGLGCDTIPTLGALLNLRSTCCTPEGSGGGGGGNGTFSCRYGTYTRDDTTCASTNIPFNHVQEPMFEERCTVGQHVCLSAEWEGGWDSAYGCHKVEEVEAFKESVRVACRADSECRDSNGGGEPNNGWTRCSSDNCNPCGHNPSFIEAVGIGGVIGIAIGGLFVLAACAAGVFWCINGRPGWNATQNPRAGARVFNPANEEPPPPKYEEAAQGEYVQVSPPV